MDRILCVGDSSSELIWNREEEEISLAPGEEGFQFSIDTRQTNTGLNSPVPNTFSIPTSGNGGNTATEYNWFIDWGDGLMEYKSGTSGTTAGDGGVGILHTYATPGEYLITIKPADDRDAWFRAFGFWTTNTAGTANTTANRQKVVSPLTPLTVKMFASDGSTDLSLVNDVCRIMFYGCNGVGFTLGDNFGFDDGWDSVVSVGNSFCYNMFNSCSSLTSLPSSFNLPVGITTVGANFCSNMFASCHSLTALPSLFNPPTKIATAGAFFCYRMFFDCGSLVVNADFRFPLLPQLVTGPTVAFSQTFCNCTKAQTVNALTIINGNPAPSSARQTFSRNFPDYASLPANWKQ